MVFACLMLSVFATIDAYETTASEVLFYMVSSRLDFVISKDLLNANTLFKLTCKSPIRKLLWSTGLRWSFSFAPGRRVVGRAIKAGWADCALSGRRFALST